MGWCWTLSLYICSSALWCGSPCLYTAFIQSVGPLMEPLMSRASAACEECEKVAQSDLNNYFCSTVILWYKSHHTLSHFSRENIQVTSVILTVDKKAFINKTKKTNKSFYFLNNFLILLVSVHFPQIFMSPPSLKSNDWCKLYC